MPALPAPTPFRIVLCCSLLLSLAGCTAEDPPSVAESPAPVAQRSLTLTQGTNLAITASPTNGDLIVALQGSLLLLPANTEQAQPLLLHDDAWEPAYSPDGSHVVYQGYRNGTWDLWQLALAGGSTPQQLTSDAFDDREPQYSPDGSRVVFSSDRAGNYDLWELVLATGEVRALTTAPEEEFAPTWSSDGTHVAYVRAVSATSQVTALNVADLSTELLFTSAAPVSGLQWIPTNQGLSFRTLDRDAAGNAHTTLRLWQVGVTETRVLSEPDADVFGFRASWLDASTAVYTADGEIRIWREGQGSTARPFSVTLSYPAREYEKKSRDFDNTTPRQALGISLPALSPDGQQIAFGALGDLWLWTPGTQELKQLTDDAAADQMPAWSGDGKSLVYVSDVGGRYQVWRRELMQNTAEPLTLQAKELSYPRLSPDGSKLAYFTDVPANPLLHVTGQLTVTDLQTGATRKLLEPMPPQPLNWSADGNHVLTTRLQAFSRRYREGLFVLVCVDVNTNTAVNLVPTPHRSITHASLASDSAQVAYSQDGVLNVWQLDAQLHGVGEPRVLVDDLADSPSFSASGEYVVFQAGDRLQRLQLASGTIEDITPPLTWQPQSQSETWVLRAGRVFDGTSDQYLTNTDILIRNNRIAAVGKFDIPADAVIVDYSDKVVVPGLFESHAHIGDHNLSEEQGRLWLSYGITSVRDPGSNPYLANERKEAWTSGRRVGPRTFMTGHNIDGNRVFYAVVEGISSDRHLELSLERSRRLQVDFFKTYVRLPDRQQQRVVEFAHAMGVPVTSHELMPAAFLGVDNIEHFTGTSRRGYATKISELGRSYQDVVSVLTETGMGIVPTMVVPGVVLTFSEQDDLYSTPQFNNFYGADAKKNYQGFMGFFGPGSEGFVNAYGNLLSTLVERGALVGTGTDSPFTPFGTGLHAEFRLYQREGLQPWQILKAATIDSARIAGAERDLGSIEVGKLADFVVVDGDPLADISALDQVVMTVVNGKRYLLGELMATE
ncbi:MAG: amidohydrolase family protein [Pseudomonadota bacterium]